MDLLIQSIKTVQYQIGTFSRLRINQPLQTYDIYKSYVDVFSSADIIEEYIIQNIQSGTIGGSERRHFKERHIKYHRPMGMLTDLKSSGYEIITYTSMDKTRSTPGKSYKVPRHIQYTTVNSYPFMHNVVKPHALPDIATMDKFNFLIVKSIRVGKWVIHLIAQKPATVAELITLKASIKSGKTPQVKKDTASNYNYSLIVDYIDNSDKPNITSIIESSGPSSFKSFTGSDLVRITAVLSGSPEEMYKLYEIHKLMNPRFLASSVRGMTVQAVQMLRHDYYDIYPPIGGYITDKADGQHSLLVVYNNGVYLFYGKEVVQITPEGLDPSMTDIPKEKTVDGVEQSWLDEINVIEGEYLVTGKEHDERRELGLFLMFDVLILNGLRIHKKPFSERIEYFDAGISLFSRFAKCQKKRFRKIRELKDLSKLEKVYNKKGRDYEIDGVILYFNKKIFKWKPAEQTSIDFLAMECPKSLLDTDIYKSRPGKKLYLLFSGISKEDYSRFGFTHNIYREISPKSTMTLSYFPVQFAPSSDPKAFLFYYSGDDNLHEQIIEVVHQDDEWKLLRIRHDQETEYKLGRAVGNNFKTAENIWMLTKNPLTLDEMMDPKHNVYFKVQKSEMYKQNTAYNSFIKATLLSNLIHKGVTSIVDLGGGKGQDIQRYAGYSVKEVVIADLDPTALDMLVRKKHTLAVYNETTKKREAVSGTRFYTIASDMTDDDLPKKIRSILTGEPKLVISQFAIHYIIRKLDMLIDNIDKILSSGGTFLFTCFNGKKVYDMLKTENPWEVSIGGKRKYYLELIEQDKSFMGKKEKIKVKLPFSDELYSEDLVDIDGTIERFVARGYELISSGGFLDNKTLGIHIPKHLELNENDRKFVGLYHFVILKKK
uniref:mRNA (guanine-N(7))-methyltransferase n=1 Tax=viral metagenome TaxID=1070528 RepID=A0A6C0IWB0_9ZZZZ